MQKNGLNIAVFLILNCLILSIMTKWHKSIFLDEHKKKNLCHFLHISKKSRIFAQNFKIDGEERAYQRSRIAC